MLVSVNRLFQIPQLFRPTVSTVLANTLGHVNLERPASGLTAIAYWIHFSRWCRIHPVPRPADVKDQKNRAWLHASVIQKEGLDRVPIWYLEFGVYRGASLLWWLDRIPHLQSRFVGF